MKMKDIFEWIVALVIVLISVVASICIVYMVFKSDFESDVNFVLIGSAVIAPVISLYLTFTPSSH